MLARRALMALAALAALAAQPTLAEDGIYCDPDNCYDVLGLDRYEYPTQAHIKKAYRKLSRELHPDRNRDDPDAASKFAKVARAYEALGTPDNREEYDYALDHPDEYLSNRYRYYTRVYATETDARVVVGLLCIGLSALQYGLQYLMHQRGKEQVRKHHPKFKKEVQRLALERFEAEKPANAAATAKQRRKKKASQEDQTRLAQLEREAADELIETIDVQGGYKMPELRDLLLVKLACLPYTLPLALAANLSWYYRHSVKGEPLSRDEKMQLLTSAMGRPEEGLLETYSQEEVELMLSMEAWDRDNFRKFEEEQFRRKYPERYKQYLRYKKAEQKSSS